MTRNKVTKSARARALLDAGIPAPEVIRRTGLSRQGVNTAAGARGPRGRPPRSAEPSERVSLLVGASTAACLRDAAERDGCSLGQVVEALVDGAAHDASAARTCRECGRALDASATAAASARLAELLELLELRQQKPGETERDHRLASAERYESQLIHARVVLAHVLDDLADTCVFCSRRAREL